MPTLKANVLRRETASKLLDSLRDKRRELHSLRFLLAGGKLKNVKKIRLLRKEIARILTVLHENKSR